MNLYIKVSKFATFQNDFICGHGLSNKARHDAVQVVSFTERVVLMAVHE